MDTSKMLQFPRLTTDKVYELLVQAEENKKNTDELTVELDKAFIWSLVTEISSQYDIGTVTDVYEIFGGYVNRSFGIYTEKDGQKNEYFVRLYKQGITEKEIKFEHILLDYLKENGLDMAAGIYRTKDGNSFLKKTIGTDEKTVDRYFAIYEFLPGEDKYSWLENELTDKEYQSAAHVMALLHNASIGFDPKGLERVEPKIMELIPTLKKTFKDYAATDWNDNFTEYFRKNLDSILEEIDRITIPAEDLEKMPMNAIHCDFHPGNLKYKDEKAVGIFDFDWSKIDLRMFDLGLGIAYSCASWIDELDGTLKLEQSEVFLKAYQEKLESLNGALEPMNEIEKKHIPTMLAAGNMYLIFWALRDYYSNLGDINVYEYLAYFQHQVKLMNFIRNNWDALEEISNRI